MPLELMEDLSRGASWLSFARNSSTLENKHAIRALKGLGENARPEKIYTGKTYDSADSIAEFFRKRGQQMNPSPAQPDPPVIRRAAASTSSGNSQPAPRSSSNNSGSSSGSSSAASGDFTPGSHVRHPKYGRGLVLRREGTGDSAKLTVSFPGFGQKKLIENMRDSKRREDSCAAIKQSLESKLKCAVKD
jgi:DNA helicase-2/ATP-dependent DNA helicase PcrA